MPNTLTLKEIEFLVQLSRLHNVDLTYQGLVITLVPKEPDPAALTASKPKSPLQQLMDLSPESQDERLRLK